MDAAERGSPSAESRTYCLLSADDPKDPKAVVCIRMRSEKPLRFGYLHIRKPEGHLKNASLLIPSDDPVVVVEGFSDTAAAMDLGFVAIGRPSNLACLEMVRDVVKGRQVIIVGENDKKADARWPGKEGALATFQSLRSVCKDVKWVMPPPHEKDLRSWKVRQQLTRDEFLAHVEKSGETVRDVAAMEGPVLTCLADVVPREVPWLWPGRFPLGRLSLLVGRPGEGKSFLTMDMAARVTRGSYWPDGSACPAGSVILISAEDDAADTIQPRLVAHNADLSRVHLMSMVRRIRGGKLDEVMFTLSDVNALDTALQAHPDCKLVVVDPIGSFLGGATDAHRDNDVRSVLAPIGKLAEKYGVAVVLVAHRRKGEGNHADDLALGSRAFTGIARVTWHLSRDPSNAQRRLLLAGKSNLGPESHGLAFTIGGHAIADFLSRERRPGQT